MKAAIARGLGLLRECKMIRFFEEDSRRRLYDLGKDAGEERDVAATKPDVGAALEKRLNDYFSATPAGLPKPNPNFIPNGERSGDRKSGGKGRKKR